jgi:hypothetical protein
LVKEKARHEKPGQKAKDNGYHNVRGPFGILKADIKAVHGRLLRRKKWLVYCKSKQPSAQGKKRQIGTGKLTFLPSSSSIVFALRGVIHLVIESTLVPKPGLPVRSG